MKKSTINMGSKKMEQKIKKQNKDIYLYNIGYYTYEESEYIQLYHNKKYSKKEFEILIGKITKSLLIEFDTSNKSKITFQDMILEVADMMISIYGFKKVKFTAEFSVFGWANILDKNDWKIDRDDQLKFLEKMIKGNEE